jgi:hypothetical protein
MNIRAKEIVHVDESGEVYFIGTEAHRPLEKHLYRSVRLILLFFNIQTNLFRSDGDRWQLNHRLIVCLAIVNVGIIMLVSVLAMVITTFSNVGDHRFHLQHCIIERKNWVTKSVDPWLPLTERLLFISIHSKQSKFSRFNYEQIIALYRILHCSVERRTSRLVVESVAFGMPVKIRSHHFFSS